MSRKSLTLLASALVALCLAFTFPRDRNHQSAGGNIESLLWRTWKGQHYVWSYAWTAGGFIPGAVYVTISNPSTSTVDLLIFQTVARPGGNYMLKTYLDPSVTTWSGAATNIANCLNNGVTTAIGGYATVVASQGISFATGYSEIYDSIPSIGFPAVSKEQEYVVQPGGAFAFGYSGGDGSIPVSMRMDWLEVPHE